MFKPRKMSEKDYNRLKHSGCPWTPEKLDDVVIEDVVDGEELGNVDMIEGSFHPNGCTGCTIVDDDYICGHRCDHLIWISGWCEHYGKPSKDETTIRQDDCLLLVANHKGVLRISLVYETYEPTLSN